MPGVVAALVVVGAVPLLTNLGAVIRAAVEGHGSEATGTQVTLASADVSLTTGEGSLEGLVVARPEGFEPRNAFELGNVTPTLDPATVASDVIVIREIGAPS